MTIKSKISGSIRGLSYGSMSTSLKRGAYKAGRFVARRPLTVSFFHRVDDPGSLLMAEALARLAEQHAFSLRFVVVPEPAAEVDPEPELSMALARREAALLSELLGGPALPREIEPPPAARVRLVQAILLEQTEGQEALRLAIETGRALFWDDGEGIAELGRRHGTAAGLDVRGKLEENYRALRAAGHFSGGTAVLDGEIFHGVARLPYLEARLSRREAEAPLFPLEVELGASLPALDSPPTVRVYASFQCPYSYLGVMKLLSLAEQGKITLEERPIRPLVMRGLRVPAYKKSYALMDAAREAARAGIPFGPSLEPDDAGVSRAIFVWHEASQEGKGLDFFVSALSAIWSEAADLMSDDDLRAIAVRAGLDEEIVERGLGNREGLARVEAHREARRELGLWGVPSFEALGFSTWGQDRLPLLVEVLRRRAEDPA